MLKHALEGNIGPGQCLRPQKRGLGPFPARQLSQIRVLRADDDPLDKAALLRRVQGMDQKRLPA